MSDRYINLNWSLRESKSVELTDHMEPKEREIGFKWDAGENKGSELEWQKQREMG